MKPIRNGQQNVILRYTSMCVCMCLVCLCVCACVCMLEYPNVLEIYHTFRVSDSIRTTHHGERSSSSVQRVKKSVGGGGWRPVFRI